MFRLLGQFVRLFEDIGLAGVPLALNSCDNPIARTYDVAAFQGLDPTMAFHEVTALFANTIRRVIGSAVSSNHLAFTREGIVVAGNAWYQFRFIFWMIAIPEPLMRLDNNRLLTVLSQTINLQIKKH